MAPPSIVTVQRLNHYYGTGHLRQQVLFEIDLEIQAGEFVIMTGPSGSGKSTLLSLIGCLRSVQSGSLRVLGQELRGASDRQRTQVRRNFGYIFQASNLLSFLTVEQNIAAALTLKGIDDRPRQRPHIESILNSVGLLPQQFAYPRQLSGGQKQRAAIAGALVTQPRLVLADEPTAALDSGTGRQTIELMRQLALEKGAAVLLVTHDPRILDVADRIIQVEDGRLGLAYSQELSLAIPGLKEEQISAMAVEPDLREVQPGELVFQEGDRAEEFYVVLQGEVEVFQTVPSAPEAAQPHQTAAASAPPRLQILNTLGRGQYFGEIGLLQDQSQRTASVRASAAGPATLMVLGRSQFQQLAQGSQLTTTAIAQTLQNRLNVSLITAALPGAAVAQVLEVLPQVKKTRYGPGSTLWRAEQSPESPWLYIIASGTVERLSLTEAGQWHCLQTLGPGDYFGDRPLDPQTLMRASDQTLVEVLTLPLSLFRDLTAHYQQTHTNIARLLYERLKQKR